MAAAGPRPTDGAPTARPAPAAPPASSSPDKPLFSLGLIADIQYADMADSGVEGRVQRFRDAPPKLEAAVEELGRLAGARKIQAVLTLGDITNGNREDPARNPSDLETVASILDRLPPDLPVYHVLGNHCLDLPRDDVLARLRFPLAADHEDEEEKGGGGGFKDASGRPRRVAHYCVPLAPGWRLIALDTTELSGHTQAGPAAVAESAAYLAAHPLSEAEPQMSLWNGGIGGSQATWLAAQLRVAKAVGDRVIVAGHHQAGPDAAVRRTHAAWNWEAIAGLVSGDRVGLAPDATGGVVPSSALIYLAGHDHCGGYAHAGGVHWVTLEALVEAPPGSNAWAVLDVYPDRAEVRGRGSVTSRVLPFSSGWPLETGGRGDVLWEKEKEKGRG